ncbi:MAG: heavy-metal-associated domain-containing protein [Candidatus Latescibacteria bacterium]|nr:heavy-metal-associated domain-containing protein [Candidatus Latescibacterota bacterium]
MSKLTVTVEGMTCEHCERTVERALKGVSGVISAKANHTKGIVEIRLEEEHLPDTATLKAAVDEAGYRFVG